MDDKDATLLNMTKTRLSLLRMEDSNLKKLALKSIAKNYRFYAHNDIKEQNLEKMPNTLRNKVLEEFSHHLKSEDVLFSEEEFLLRLAMFRRLINPQTLKVDLTGCLLYSNSMTHLKDSFVEMLLNVLENAPNLEELTIGSNILLSSYITKEWASKLTQLRKLKSLKISSLLCFNDIDHLLNVCQHMPNLQVIWVRVSKIPDGREPTLQYLESCFPSLIVHNIEASPAFRVPERFKSLESLLDELCCLNAQKSMKVYLTEAKIFCVDHYGGIDADRSKRTIYTGSPGNFRRVSIEMMKGANIKQNGDKIYRSYYQDDWEEPPDRKVPVEEIKDGQEDSRFTCIRFVDGGCSFPKAIKKYQDSCWRNVRTFTIENLSIWRPAKLYLNISLIAGRFPNLERLILKDASIVNGPSLNFMNLSSLKELQLYEPEYELRHRPARLSTIFSMTPNLERARLKGTVCYFFTVEDLKEVTSMIANNTILRKLQKLKIELRAVSTIDQRGDKITNMQIPEENIERVIKLLKTASAFLPRLTEIDLTTLDSRGNKIRNYRRRDSEGNFLPTDIDSICERHRFIDFLDAFQ